MSELHRCPHPGCAARVPDMMWACLVHWQALPPPLRQQIWFASRDSGPRLLAQASARDAALRHWRRDRTLVHL